MPQFIVDVIVIGDLHEFIMQVAKREGGQQLQGALLLELLNRRFGDAQSLVDHQESS